MARRLGDELLRGAKSMSDIQDLLSQAVFHHGAGRLQAAEHLYRALLAIEPDHPEANHGFGALAMELGQVELGLSHLQRALELAPDTERYWLGLAEGFLIAGQPEKALVVIERAMSIGLETEAARELHGRIQAWLLKAEASAAPPSSPKKTASQVPPSLSPHARSSVTSIHKHRRKQPKRPGRRPSATLALADKEAWVKLFNARRLPEAEAMARRFTHDCPGDAFAWKALGASLVRLQHYMPALAALDEALCLSPKDAEISNFRGITLQALDRLPEALEAWTQAVELRPEFAEAHNNRGNVLQTQDRLDEAVESYRRALAIDSNYVEALNNLGAVLQQQGHLEEALVFYRQILDIHRLQPIVQEIEIHVHHKIGNLLYELGRANEAIAHFEQVLAIKPDDEKAINNLGNSLQDLGRLPEALIQHQRAIELRPDFANAHNSLGATYKAMGRLEAALACYERALEIMPDFVHAHNNAGIALQDLGRFEEAESHYRQALEIQPDYSRAYDNLLFTINYHPDKSIHEIFAAYQEFDRVLGLPKRDFWRLHLHDRNPERRLRIGYVSPDFRRHSARYFLEPLLANHDSSVVEVTAYAELRREDEWTERYRGYVDHWVVTSGMSDAALAERIRADGIDILIDLAGHTSGNRLGVFALKPAPVSVSWLGYGYTTGLTAIDYFLADAIVAPPGSEAFFAETPWRLDPVSFVYRPADGMAEVGPLPARQGRVTFGTLTRAVRINHRTLRVWSEILKRVPDSRLMIDSLHFADPVARERLAARFAAHGIGAERLMMGYHTPPWDIMNEMDIALDCFPHNSGTTLFEHLYMGTPFVTLAERPSVGRLGSTILHALGHPEWIAATEEDYIEIVVGLATHIDRLADIRATLRDEMLASALMDEVGFVRRVEQAYRAMWRHWCEPLEASAIEHPKNIDRATQTEQDAIVALIAKQHLHQAEAAARILIERYPDDAFGWKARGSLLLVLGRQQEALSLLERANQLAPGDPECLTNIGCVLRHLGRLEEAEIYLRKAIDIQPDLALPYNHLGLVLMDEDRLHEAREKFEKALSLKPDDAQIYSNYGIVLQNFGDISEALKNYNRALRIQPNLTLAFNNKLFALNYHPDVSDSEIISAYREYDRRFGIPHRKSWCSPLNDRDPSRPLRIGYVSPDFRCHSAQYFLEPLLANHDKNSFEIIAYAALKREDQCTLRYKSYVDYWVPTDGMTDAALAERIRADRVDILVDLAGHTNENRLAVFARKPAPVSVTWLGYGCTTGLSAIDYFLTDLIICPEGGEALFSETPWRLANPPFAYRPNAYMGKVGPLPALSNGFITFGSLTRAIRLNHRSIRVWATLLKQVPDSRLIIDSRNFADSSAQAEWATRFAKHGVEPERLVMGYHSPPWDVLRTIDIGLDCFPHNSGTTLFEHLYQGMPFVTLAGRPGVGRLGASILHGVGHPEWIAESEDDYIEIAVALASDLETLRETREGLRNQMQCSPLMDEADFCRRIEQAYREMWRHWCMMPG